MLPVGAIAPQFETQDQHGERLTLDGLLSNGRLVLYFYPKDFTSVCTAQACMFRDAHAEMGTLGVQVVGVSGDDVSSHQRFADQHHVKFPLLADPERKIINAYKADGLFKIVKRVTYVIDTDRRILGAFQHQLSAQKHLDDIRRLLDKN